MPKRIHGPTPRILRQKRGEVIVVGGYPPGQNGAITRPGEYPLAEAQRRIAALRLPHGDPVAGPEGPLIEAWKIR